MPNLRNGSKGDSNPGSLDCESGILPLSHRAPHDVARAIAVCNEYYRVCDVFEIYDHQMLAG